MTRLTETEKKAHDRAKAKFVESCISKWSETDVAGKSLIKLHESSPARAACAAVAIENQEKHFKLLTEQQLSTAFGTALRPEHLLKSVFIGSAQSKLADMFTVIPLASTDDVYMYVYTNYGTTLRGSTAGARNFETQSPYYAGETYPPTDMTGSINGSNKTFTASLAPTPIVPLWVKIYVNGALVARDNGSGSIINVDRSTAIDTSATNTVDYATGATTINFATAPASGSTVKVEWNSSLEGKTNFDSYAGELTIELRKERFNARPFPLGFNYSMMTQIMLDSDNIGNAHEILTTRVGQELAKAKDERGIKFVASIARTNAIRKFNAQFSSAGAVDRQLWAQNVTNAINNVSAEITNDQQRGEVNKIVGGPLAIAYLRNHNRFTPDDSELGYAGARKVGTLDGREVFQIPATSAGVLGNNELLLTFSNPLVAGDSPALFGNLTDLSAELTYPQLYTQGTLASVYDQRMINSGFARILQLDGMPTDYSIA